VFAYFILARKQSKGKPGRKYESKSLNYKAS
jgi:hypothetical protein